MPIDYSKYPANWKNEIRPAILDRDCNSCNFCGLMNGLTGYRDSHGRFYETEMIIDRLENTGYDYFQNELENCFDKKDNPTSPIKIVLTIAHLDHNTANNDYNNLAALCQRCHLLYDAVHHLANRMETRERRRALQRLF